ncbi:hypothetical protein GCM10012280_66400 [Wenjunlia tyrosinilytica]|uniref:HEAT repeat domain-containing protein n=1 Tax=Wenjunlia tyrosinilytica TaxID=1544741 RepID=A0A917ZYA2_9ACTN|nr:hypothetical protein GCM10012280_66400 [Wenjunlia tyrosinilytica]
MAGSWWRWRRIAFRDPLDTRVFADFASSEGWWYAGHENHEWRGSTLVWHSLDGAIIGFSPGDTVSVSFAEVSADEPEVRQRAMAEAEAMVLREFRCFTVSEALGLLRATKGEARALVLTAAAASAPDRYCPEVADAVTSALFAPEPPVRAAALRAVMLTEWPQLARPLAAHALTEADDGLASFARALAEQVYHENAYAHLVQPPAPTPQDLDGPAVNEVCRGGPGTTAVHQETALGPTAGRCRRTH